MSRAKSVCQRTIHQQLSELVEGRGGAVLLELTVTVDGTVIDAVVVEEAGYGFDQAA